MKRVHGANEIGLGMQVTTHLSLPPRHLERDELASVLAATLGVWIVPERYGHIEPTRRLPDDADPVPLLLDSYVTHHDLVLGQHAGDVTLEIVPPRPGRTSFARYIAWEGWPDAPWLERTMHRDAVWQVMRLTGAPLAIAAPSDAHGHYAVRTVVDELGERWAPTVPDYRHGLQHPHWRMWFGREYRDFLGVDALDAAPATARHDFGDGYFVELFEDPAAWDTDEGRAAADAFAAAIPRRVFYDPNDPEATLEAPDFSHLLPT